jgi:hypothetical protein
MVHEDVDNTRRRELPEELIAIENRILLTEELQGDQRNTFGVVPHGII